MAKSNNYNGLNPVVVQALNNLQYRYRGETPEMWCSRVRYPFKTLLEYNPKYFSKNGFIQMIERVYIDGEFKAGRRSFHIYCTVCDSLIIIRENTIECANDHLKKCNTAKRRSTSIQKNTKKGGSVLPLSSDKIDEIYRTYCFKFSKGLANYSYDYSHDGRKRIVNRLVNNAKVIQRAWRAFKLRPETWAKRVWNMVRNDGTPDEKKFLGITPRKIRVPDDRYIYFLRPGYRYDEKIQAKDVPAYAQNIPALYDHYTPQSWAEKKSEQLWRRLNNVAYIVAFIELHLQGYRIVEYSDWSYMLKWLSNPEYYRIDKYLNNGNENFVRSSEYARYKCKLAGKHYQYNLLDIDYYKTGNISINGEYTTIDFSDSNNNCKYVQRIFQTIDSLFK